MKSKIPGFTRLCFFLYYFYSKSVAEDKETRDKGTSPPVPLESDVLIKGLNFGAGEVKAEDAIATPT